MGKPTMKITVTVSSFLMTLSVVAVGLLIFTPVVFRGRVGLGLRAGAYSLTGVDQRDVPAIVKAVARDLSARELKFELRGRQLTYNLRDLGVVIDQKKSVAAIGRMGIVDVVANNEFQPIIVFDDDQLNNKLTEAFAGEINEPDGASLKFDKTGKLLVVSSQRGEVIAVNWLKTDIKRRLVTQKGDSPIDIHLVDGEAEVQDSEVVAARDFANKLLEEGLALVFADETVVMKPYTVKRLISFVPQVDRSDSGNIVLGVKFDADGLRDYLTATVAPGINRPARDARFVLAADGRVRQFSLPQRGQQLNIEQTVSRIASRLAQRERVVKLAVQVTEPLFSDLGDIKDLGLTTKLATGESDYAGSPANRRHNIIIGASRYHGLIIPPGDEFSFNEFLGPVNAAAGFKPELVIKENVTTPEFGGGLCQVSTTLFRAALNAGLKITQRRSHSYAVSYYGKPGLDATIYPPYTDLRFLNNTLGYILIQTRIEGTKLAFDFWGTDDGRKVAVIGPITYDRQPDGSLKAYVEQQVTLGGRVMVDETFYSRYKSPKLFPKVLAANDEASPVPATGSAAAVKTKNKDDIKSTTTTPEPS